MKNTEIVESYLITDNCDKLGSNAIKPNRLKGFQSNLPHYFSPYRRAGGFHLLPVQTGMMNRNFHQETI